MKLTNLFGIVLFSICSVMMCSCDNSDLPDDDMIWDFTCFDIAIQVKNAAGEDLLNPETTGCITDKGLKAIYKEKVYEKDSTLNKAYPRFNMPRWEGLHTYKKDNQYYLMFGEFTPCSDYHAEKFILDWNDGTKDTISFDLYITWKKKEPTVHFNMYLNDKKVEKELVIVK